MYSMLSAPNSTEWQRYGSIHVIIAEPKEVSLKTAASQRSLLPARQSGRPPVGPPASRVARQSGRPPVGPPAK
eukprot:6214774-Pleurochrysis_carterae.AAC.4